MKDMEGKVHSAMDRQCDERSYAAPVDVLMDIGLLDKKELDDWRRGRTPYLEAVCKGNLHKLSAITREMKSYARSKGWKENITEYRQWGSKSRVLRFSKSGDPNIEKTYSTHYCVNKK